MEKARKGKQLQIVLSVCAFIVIGFIIWTVILFALPSSSKESASNTKVASTQSIHWKFVLAHCSLLLEPGSRVSAAEAAKYPALTGLEAAYNYSQNVNADLIFRGEIIDAKTIETQATHYIRGDIESYPVTEEEIFSILTVRVEKIYSGGTQDNKKEVTIFYPSSDLTSENSGLTVALGSTYVFFASTWKNSVEMKKSLSSYGYDKYAFPNSTDYTMEAKSYFIARDGYVAADFAWGDKVKATIPLFNGMKNLTLEEMGNLSEEDKKKIREADAKDDATWLTFSKGYAAKNPAGISRYANIYSEQDFEQALKYLQEKYPVKLDTNEWDKQLEQEQGGVK